MQSLGAVIRQSRIFLWGRFVLSGDLINGIG